MCAVRPPQRVSWDALMPVDHARDMKAALNRAGVPAELYIVRGLGHLPLFLFNRSAMTEGIDFLDRILREGALNERGFRGQ